jgi:hypothetical protein
MTGRVPHGGGVPVIAGAAALLLAGVGPTTRRAAAPDSAQAIAADGCSPARIQSLESWQLQRVAPGRARRKRSEAAFGRPAPRGSAARAPTVARPSCSPTAPAAAHEFAWRWRATNGAGPDVLIDAQRPAARYRRVRRPSVDVCARIGDHQRHQRRPPPPPSRPRLAALRCRARPLTRTLRRSSLETDNGFFNYYDTTRRAHQRLRPFVDSSG